MKLAISWITATILGPIAVFFVTSWFASVFSDPGNSMAPMSGLGIIITLYFAIPTYLLFSVILISIIGSPGLRYPYWKRLAIQTGNFSFVYALFTLVLRSL